jgi:hypothetical protein
MWFNDTIELGAVTETVTYGEPIKTYTWRKVYADNMGDGRKETTQGDSSGLIPELKFVIRAFEYEGENAVRYNSKTYTVIRADTQGDRTFLYLTKAVE